MIISSVVVIIITITIIIIIGSHCGSVPGAVAFSSCAHLVVPVMLGNTGVITRRNLNGINVLNLQDINEMVLESLQGDDEAKHGVEVMMDVCHRKIYETFLGFLGEDDRVSGTMGEPAIHGESVYLLKDALETTVVEVCKSYRRVESVWRLDFLLNQAFVHYLHRFM